jgi:hypothetical protein
MNEREIINAWIDFGKALANLEAIENILEHAKYDSDALHAIKCVLDMIEEEKE